MELVSIITPVYNNFKDIEACILSVAMQTYVYKEHWIIDGGSTDGTLDLIKQYATQYNHIRWISEKDKGIYDAMNKGIGLAKGDWIYFLGSDDQLFNENVLTEVFTDKNLIVNDILYGNIFIKERGIIFGNPVELNDLKWNCTHHQATFTRKSVFTKHGVYDLRFKICADWAYTIKCFQDKDLKIKYMDKIIAIYSTLGTSNTAFGNNPRISDINFDHVFISLFPGFSVWEHTRLYMDDHLPKYLNPFKYYFYFSRLRRKHSFK